MARKTDNWRMWPLTWRINEIPKLAKAGWQFTTKGRRLWYRWGGDK